MDCDVEVSNINKKIENNYLTHTKINLHKSSNINPRSSIGSTNSNIEEIESYNSVIK